MYALFMLCPRKKNLLLFTIFIIMYFSIQVVWTQPQDYSFNDPVFLTDQVITYGEENFINRIGLKENPNITENAPKFIPIKETQTEMPLGLVLSGGAARAFAHIGVLRELETQGIFPDFLVVNSMGSLVALLYAAGLSPDQIEKIVSDYSMDFLFTARFPLDGGLIDDSNMISAVYNILGKIDIKDLEIPIVVYAEDLLSRRTVAFMEGDFYSILSATIAMPIAFPPVRYNDMILIDGGTTNLVPVFAASEYTNRIITSASFSNNTGEYRDVLSVITRSLDLAKTRKGITEIKTVDTILIRCNVEDISYMAFDKAHDIIQRGEESAKQAIGDIKTRGFDTNTTWTPDRMQDLQIKRDNLAKIHDDVVLGYKKTNIIQKKEYTGYISGGVQMYSSPNDNYYLDNSDYFFLSQRAEIANIAGELREYFDPWNGVGIDARLQASFFDFLTLENRVAFKWDSLFDNGFAKGFEGIYYYGNLTANITNDGNNGIAPFFSWESFFANNGGLQNGNHFSLGRTGADFYIRNFSISPYVFAENQSTMGFGIKNVFNIPLTSSLFITQKTASRFPFNFNNEVSLYKNDGLRGSITEGNYNYFVVTNNNLTYTIETVGTLFDTVSIKNLAFSAFCDYYKTDVHGISAGGELGVELAIIGLVSIHVSGYGGYDITREEGFGGFSIGGKI